MEWNNERNHRRLFSRRRRYHPCLETIACLDIAISEHCGPRVNETTERARSMQVGIALLRLDDTNNRRTGRRLAIEARAKVHLILCFGSCAPHSAEKIARAMTRHADTLLDPRHIRRSVAQRDIRGDTQVRANALACRAWTLGGGEFKCDSSRWDKKRGTESACVPS